MHAAEADRASRNAALTLTLALPADTVLYLLLPLHASTFGVTLPEAGILLAANRIVRIFRLSLGRPFLCHPGPRAACLWAVAGAVLSAFGYAVLAGLWPLLLARLLWGLAFAAMNIANQALPTAQLGAAARRMGRARAIVAVGPMLALFAAGILADLLGPRAVFLPVGLRLPCWRPCLPSSCRPPPSGAARAVPRSAGRIASAYGPFAWALRSMACLSSGSPLSPWPVWAQRCHCRKRCDGVALRVGNTSLARGRRARRPLRCPTDADLPFARGSSGAGPHQHSGAGQSGSAFWARSFCARFCNRCLHP
jgi:MFS family permease